MPADLLHLTSSQKRLIRSWVREIAVRDSIDEDHILPGLTSDPFFSGDRSAKDKGEKFFSMVRKLRYPHFCEAELRFSELEKNFFHDCPQLKQVVSIMHSENFEEEALELRLQLSPDNLEEVLNYLVQHQDLLKNCMK
ncbi:MAG: hypothetical protein PHQ23_15230 [Candidatus Wallbacteria bacterium]|nr:hypothetical protein [Candidatus Wallbacteria bacterium]